MFRSNQYVFMDAAGTDGGAGAAAGAAPSGGIDQGAAGGQSAAPASGNAGGSGGSVLAAGAAALGGSVGAQGSGAAATGSGQPAGQAATGAQPGAASGIPEKYQVKKSDGTLDVEASYAKLLEGHRALEQRMGSGGAPPKTPDDYKVELQGVDPQVLAQDPEYQDFVKNAHAKGMNNDLFNFSLGEYIKRTIPNPGRASEDLRTNHWKDETSFRSNSANAVKALNEFGRDLTNGERAMIDGNSGMLRVLANVGSKLGEDKQPIIDDTSAAETWQQQVDVIRNELKDTSLSQVRRDLLLKKQGALYDKKFLRK